MGFGGIVGCCISGAETWALVYAVVEGKLGDGWAGEHLSSGETTVGDGADRGVDRRRVKDREVVMVGAGGDG